MAAGEDEVRDGHRDALAWMLACLDGDAEAASAVLGNSVPVMVSGALAQMLVDELDERGIDVRDWLAGHQATARELAGR